MENKELKEKLEAFTAAESLKPEFFGREVTFAGIIVLWEKFRRSHNFDGLSDENMKYFLMGMQDETPNDIIDVDFTE